MVDGLVLVCASGTLSQTECSGRAVPADGGSAYALLSTAAHSSRIALRSLRALDVRVRRSRPAATAGPTVKHTGNYNEKEQ